jgi:hypothetical protein
MMAQRCKQRHFLATFFTLGFAHDQEECVRIKEGGTVK